MRNETNKTNLLITLYEFGGLFFSLLCAPHSRRMHALSLSFFLPLTYSNALCMHNNNKSCFISFTYMHTLPSIRIHVLFSALILIPQYLHANVDSTLYHITSVCFVSTITGPSNELQNAYHSIF